MDAEYPVNRISLLGRPSCQQQFLRQWLQYDCRQALHALARVHKYQLEATEYKGCKRIAPCALHFYCVHPFVLKRG